jgi:uncharacterized membrane protein YkoI
MQSTSLVAIALAIALPATSQSEQDKEWSKRVAETAFPLVEAIKKGLQEAREGFVFKAELELDKGRLVYSIDVAQGNKTLNVVLDAKDGKLVEREQDSEDHSGEVGACKVTLVSAIEAALRKSPGKAIEATLAMRDHKPVIEIVVFDGKSTTVPVDGLTGDVQGAAGPAAATEAPRFTDVFDVPVAELSSTGTNPYFVLEPGYKLVLEGKDGAKNVRLEVTVLKETRRVGDVETRVVEERETADGQLVEVSRNFFAISKRTNDVYYFGEDVDIYEDGKVKSHEGAWLSGENGARFGLMIPGTPLLGARYYQEIAPGIAMDRVEVVGLDVTSRRRPESSPASSSSRRRRRSRRARAGSSMRPASAWSATTR